MYLHLIEVVYTVEARGTVEKWLTQAHPDSVVISIEQYGNEILAILASKHMVKETQKEMPPYPVISSYDKKQRAVYRITTASAPEHALCSFPFSCGEEWYLGRGKTMYLSVQSHQLNDRQITWLAENSNIIAWEYMFDLTSVLEVGV